MTKLQFTSLLRKELAGLPENEVNERIDFYIEIIEDRMEDGLSEEEAVDAVGSIEEIKSQIIADIPLSKIAKEKMQPKRHLAIWEIILIILGSPIWLSVLIAVLAVFLSVYIVLWSVIISLWSVFVSVIACSVVGIITGAGFTAKGFISQGFALIGSGIFCAGISILIFFGCKSATKALILLTKKFAVMIKKCFIKKEGAQ